jgi:hypothetical protein
MGMNLYIELKIIFEIFSNEKRSYYDFLPGEKELEEFIKFSRFTLILVMVYINNS